MANQDIDTEHDPLSGPTSSSSAWETTGTPKEPEPLLDLVEAGATDQDSPTPRRHPRHGHKIEYERVDVDEYHEGDIAKLRIIITMSELARQTAPTRRARRTAELVTVDVQKVRFRLTHSQER
ncbi:hypothetical protein [Rhodococcus koreensis]|uniref:hypothetical protein n=1 Tax=Rhodococcus koreensis TaxID=99653 RepID=UPI0036DF88E5